MLDVAPLASELRIAVHRLTRRLRQQTPTDGLTLTQLSALTVIWRDGPLTAGDLAAREQVRPPSITRVLTGLEALNLVERQDNPRDGRQVLVQITPLGSHRMQHYVRARELWLAQQLAALSDDERDLLGRATVLLERLAAHQQPAEQEPALDGLQGSAPQQAVPRHSAPEAAAAEASADQRGQPASLPSLIQQSVPQQFIPQDPVSAASPATETDEIEPEPVPQTG